MPQASAFDRHFSAEEQRNLAAWLDANPHVTVDDFHALLSERGLTVARSTAGEAKRRIECLGETATGRPREGRRAMDALADDTRKRGRQASGSRALIEMTRTLLFEFQSAMLDADEAMDVEALQRMLRGLHDLMKAAHHNQVAGEALRREIHAKVVDEVVEEARRKGLSAEGAAHIRAKYEGAT